MNIIIEHGSNLFIILSLFFVLENTDFQHKMSICFLFITSILYHSSNTKIKDGEHYIYVHNKKYEIIRTMDKMSIAYLYIYNSRILEKYPIFIRYLLCYYVSINETRLRIFLLSCVFFTFSYFTIMPIYQSIFTFVSVLLNILLYLKIKKYTIKTKYLWHFGSSLTLIAGSYLNVAYYLPKTELYNYTNKILITIYIILVINYILYYKSFCNLSKNKSNKLNKNYIQNG